MKIKTALSIVFLVILASIFGITAAAEEIEEEIPVWSATEETKTITVVQYSEVYFRYIPTKTQKYAIKYKNDASMTHDIGSTDGEYPTRETWEASDETYHIYELKANTEYLITFLFSGSPDLEHDGTYTGSVSIMPWDLTLVMPDLPYIQEGKEVDVTISQYESVEYYFTPSEAGKYCLGHNNVDNISIWLGTVFDEPYENYPDSIELRSWKTNIQNGYQFQLEAGVTYRISVLIQYDQDTSFNIKDTIWIRKGEPPKNDYEVWDTGITKTLTLKPGDEVYYYINPTESGRYMLIKPRNIHCDIYADDAPENYDGPHNYYDPMLSEPIGTDFVGPNGEMGMVYDLVAGQDYIAKFSMFVGDHESFSYTYCFQKVGQVKSVDIFLQYFDNDTYTLLIDIDPICGGVDGVEWNVSDLSVFEIEAEFYDMLILRVKKQGKATITAKVAGITAKYELSTSYKKPVLTEGKTEYLTLYGDAATFTPKQSGKYQFTVTPKATSKVTLFYGHNPTNVYVSNEFSETIVFTADLVAGREYTFYQEGRTTTTVKSLNSSSGATTPPTQQATVPPTQKETVPPTQPVTAAPTLPSLPATEPTQNTEVPATEATPTAPTEDSTEQSTPIGSVLITEEAMQEVITSAVDGVIAFENSESAAYQISAKALQLAADQNLELSLSFPQDINIRLNNGVLKALSGSADGHNVCINAVTQSYSDLNEEQQKALEGKSIIWLLDITMSSNGESIHNLGSQAQISFPNQDTNKNWAVLYIADDGAIEVMDITSGDNITFSTNHFSQYALVLQENETNQNSNIRKYIWTAIPIALILITGCTTLLIIRNKKKKA